MDKRLGLFLVVIAGLGLFDSGYLTYEHYRDFVPPCSVHVISLVDCGTVLRSKYSILLGLPLAVWGMIQYSILLVNLVIVTWNQVKWSKWWIILQSTAGAIFSIYFIYLQLAVLKSICLYCMASAVISLSIWTIVMRTFRRERKELVIFLMGVIYRQVFKRLFFLMDPEVVHEMMTDRGELMARLPGVSGFVGFLLKDQVPQLEQEIKRINFRYPIGLAAGFDYEAKLTQTLEPWGFGFQSIGTITNNAYEGNPRPMLGRLPKSKSLLVNKGFKNEGADSVIRKIEKIRFPIPVGVSIGRTNSKELVTQMESVKDILAAFTKFEKSKMRHAYYELNISCPNLFGDVEFYSPVHLEELLTAVDKLKIKRPVFVKMPIDKSEKETLEMLRIIAKHKIAGVIFGNLQKDRKHSSFDKAEIAKWEGKKGNFSGKPTEDQSNKLINLAYKNYGKQLVIIGCGGTFNAMDAYTKIKNGASLVQMITGMIYQGPQIVMEINLGLGELLKRDGFTHISQAVGRDVKGS